MVVQRTFIKGHSFVYRLYLVDKETLCTKLALMIYLVDLFCQSLNEMMYPKVAAVFLAVFEVQCTS